MRKFLQILSFTIVYCLLFTVYSSSQPYWNEWIVFSQKYYKIPVSQNGIYRLDYQKLLSNASTQQLLSIDTRNFQIFFRGIEQHIYIKDADANNLIGPNDYIEFYGQKNDGSLDSILYKGDLYKNPVRQPNPYYSLFNDTSMYFLTWNNLTTNNRIADAIITCTACATTNYFMKEEIIENLSLIHI